MCDHKSVKIGVSSIMRREYFLINYVPFFGLDYMYFVYSNYLFDMFDASQSMSNQDYHDAVDTYNPNELCFQAAPPIRRTVQMHPNQCQF